MNTKMKKVAVTFLSILMLVSLIGCPMTPQGKVDRVEAVISSYEIISTLGYSTAKVTLVEMAKSNYWTPEALPKVKAQYLMARGDAIQAGEVLKLWVANPKTAPLAMFPTLLNQGATILGTILGGKFEMRSPAVPKKFAANKALKSQVGTPLKFTVSPEQIELAINMILVSANLISNYVGEIQDITPEAKAGFISRIEAAQKSIPLWE